MRRFIAFIIIMLPITAVLSMAAGFWYASTHRQAQDRRVPASPPAAQPAHVLNVSTMPAPTPTRIVGDDRLLHIQLSFCYQAWQQLARAGRLQDVDGVRICANNLRRMDVPDAMRGDVNALADQFAGFADEYEAGLKNTDPNMIAAAGQRITPIGEMLMRMIDPLP
jgi:hypothetical protein